MRSRRTFLAALMSGAGSCSLLQPHSLLASPAAASSEASGSYRSWLQSVLPLEDRRFDPSAKMLVTTADGSLGYHSTLTSGIVHVTRPSLTYAVALLDSGDGARAQRAKEILQTVIPLQDQNPESKTYGTWPWYMEEPLAKMSPPDPNWADFCGTQLLMAWIGHADRLGKDLRESVQNSILHAARSIQRRNVSPSYTNIAIMGTFVTLAAAQEFKVPELRTYARERLRALYSYITQQDSFSEYNSPTYTLIAIQELSRILRFVKDGRDTALVAPLHELAWKHVATHFHPPTQQWAGPHARSYETDIRRRPSSLAFLQAGTGGRANFHLGEPLPLNLEAAQVPIECPRRLARLFTELERPRQVTETFIKADAAKEGGRRSVVGRTWLHPKLTIGSVNRADFWTQRRPLVAYWGTPDQTTFLRARFLKDGADFSSALIFCAQVESNVLGTVVLCTDHGDKHPSLDPLKDGVISASDLRLRFEFGGDLRDLTAKTVEEKGKKVVQWMDRSIRYVLRPLGGMFGEAAVQWDYPELQTASRLDAVFYQGAKKEFDLKTLKAAFTSFALQEWSYDRKTMPGADIEVAAQDGRVKVAWKLNPIPLSVDGPSAPASFAVLNDAFAVAAS